MEDNPKENKTPVLPDFKLSTLFPYFLPFIVSLGVFRLMVFYGEFGIRIISFLDFSEVIISFMDILIILALGVGWSVISGKLQFSRKEYEKHKKQHAKIHSTKSEWKRIKRIVKLFAPYLIFYAVSMILLFVYSVFGDVPSFFFIYFGLVMGAVLSISIIRIVIDKRHRDFNSSQGHREFISTLLNAAMYFVIVFATAKMEANMLKENSDRKKVVITLNDKTVLTSTPKFYLIGKTANYIFLYSASEQRTEVIPTTRIYSLVYYK